MPSDLAECFVTWTSCFFQLILCGIDAPVAMAYITYNAVCPGSHHVLMADLVSLGLLATGIGTLLANTVGVR